MSIIIYIIISVSTFRYNEVKDNQHTTKEHKEENSIITKYGNPIFWKYSFVAALILVGVSNYSQFLGPYLENISFNIIYLGVVTSVGGLFEYIGLKLLGRYENAKWSGLFFFMALSISIAGAINNIISGIVCYWFICAINAPLSVIINNKIQGAISSDKRATMLSLANQVGQVFSIIFDPFLGAGIDRLGIRMTYVYVGLIMGAFGFFLKFKIVDSTENIGS